MFSVPAGDKDDVIVVSHFNSLRWNTIDMICAYGGCILLVGILFVRILSLIWDFVAGVFLCLTNVVFPRH